MGKEYGPIEYVADGCGDRLLEYQVSLFQSPAHPIEPGHQDLDGPAQFPGLYLRACDLQWCGLYHSRAYHSRKSSRLYRHGTGGLDLPDVGWYPLPERLCDRSDGRAKCR